MTKANGYKIEKRVPIPDRHGRHGAPKYPFAELGVGDSVFIDNINSSAAIASSLNYLRLKSGFHFVTRKEASGVRVWRDA